MKFEVNNIGPISHAEMNFDNKVVIVGPNSSGKTILATLFYFIISPFSFPNHPILDISNFELSEGENEIDLSKFVMKNEKAIVDTLLENLKTILDPVVFKDNSTISTDKYTLYISDKRIELNNIFPRKVRITVVREDNNLTIESPDMNIKIKAFSETRTLSIYSALLPIYSLFLEKAFSNDWYPSVFLSSERVSLLSLLPLVNYSVYSPSQIKPLKPLILDPLRFSPSGEVEVFGHKVVYRYNEAGQLKVEVYKDGLNIGNAVASGIYQYSLVKIFAKRNDIKGLIIEEPEINLHVNAQVEVARDLYNFNKKLFITTHSLWIPTILAYLLKKKVKVYEIVEGRTVERKVDEERGLVETLETILPIEMDIADKLIQGIFK